MHRNVYKITGWFIETYVDYSFKTPAYKSPKLSQDTNVKESHSIMSKVIEKIGKLENMLSINTHKNTKVENENNEEVSLEKEINIGSLDTKTESICLLEELSKLKESSREAVEGLNTFTDLWLFIF